MEHNNLIEQLSNLKLEETCLKRALDVYYMDAKARTRAFNRLKEIKNDIELIKFKLMLERKIRDEKFRKNI
ncbi:MAG: hypothetical protein J6T74_08900 [Clostridia bacterium]|nr:hypothetical protein [Clostridia bacterium]